MRLLIANGYLVDPLKVGSGVTDILVEDGNVVKLGINLPREGSKVLDAQGLHVFPGLVDAHCHLRDPGYEYKEDITSGTRSAAAGGFTSVCCMPNTLPVLDNESMIRYVMEKARRVASVKVYPIGAITVNQEGKALTDMGKMKQAGIVAVSDDGRHVEDVSLMKKALEYASMFGLTVISHCEDSALSRHGVMNEGLVSTLLGLRGIPSIAEDIMVAREVLLSSYTGVPVHIAHVSTEASIEIIRRAKERGIKVTCETCPHYFTLTENQCLHFNTLAKVNPPLRRKEDVQAVIQGIRDGTVDIIATDHAPHHSDEKQVEFDLALNGISGFETAFSLAYTVLVEGGILTLEELTYRMSTKPAMILGIQGGRIREGDPADITVADTREEWIVDVNRFYSKGKNSPFHGNRLKGKIRYVLVNGIVVHEGETVCSQSN